SFPYDASHLAPAVPDIVDASLDVVATSLAAVATSEPIYHLQGPSESDLWLPHLLKETQLLSDDDDLVKICG
ncbi:hypothetical protein A2U01_0094835, partial [Trifolium medium]|nr:hypothetical protein [Trifolium medium]